MRTDVLEQAVELRARGEPFVLATVVAYRRPQSAKPGSHAIVFPDGSIHGWVGGGCVQPIVIREAKKALEQGRPSLIVISPDGAVKDWQGVQEYLMTCQGGGSLQIYLEPMLPRPELIIFGNSPVAQTLAELGKLLDFRVSDSASGTSKAGPGSYVVIATMGDGDEEALRAAASSQAAYIGFVASREKSAKLFQHLREKGVPEDQLKRIKSPAGLELGAETLPEIAFAVMAEILQHAKQNKSAEQGQKAKIPVLQSRPEAIDPICGMFVDVATAKYSSTHDGKPFYFCCLNCKETFDRTPAQYAR